MPRPAATSPSSLAVACARALSDRLAEDVLVLDVRGLTVVADLLVLATATSPPHMRALVEAVGEALEKAGTRCHHVEGGHESPWVLVDCVDLIVHVFRPESRRYYDLERLWADARRVRWTGREKAATKSGKSARLGHRRRR